MLLRSGGAKSCTSYATCITYKEDAADDIRVSDVVVQFLTDQEIADCIREQIHLLAEILVSPDAGRQEDISNENDDKGIDESSDSAARDHEDQNLPADPNNEMCPSNKIIAKTAKEFFGIIFNTKEDNEAETLLDRELHAADIEAGRFFQICFDKAKERLAQIGTEFFVQNGIARLHNIPDRDLEKSQLKIKELWPFVKCVTIATGHILLRHGLQLIDLPDTSQLREKVINEYRWNANFEMVVVVPSSRFETSIKQEQYLDRSIRLMGADKTVLVLNKVDALIGEDTMSIELQMVNEAPFPALLEQHQALFNDALDRDVIDTTLERQREDLLKKITAAFVKHQTDCVQERLLTRGIKVLPASAKVYWQLNGFRRKQCNMDMATTGIESIRRFLSRVGATANYNGYHDHVFQVLPALRRQAYRYLESHKEDQTFAAVRQKLENDIPALQQNLQDILSAQIRRKRAWPWSREEEQFIVNDIKDIAENSWVYPTIHFNGFKKMLKENGIPVSGKYYGRNLNDEILQTMNEYLEKWHTTMIPRGDALAKKLIAPVHTFLQNITTAISETSAHTDLKNRAGEELEFALAEVDERFEALISELHNTLRKTYLHFTTEIDIGCPIAKWMMPVYRRASNYSVVGSGRGLYMRMRKKLLDSIIEVPLHNPRDRRLQGRVYHPLLVNHGGALVAQQRLQWQQKGDKFISTVIELILGFSRTAEELLESSNYMAAEQQEAQTELKSLLVQFDKSHKKIKKRFEVAHPDGSNKKIKLEVDSS
ncbi:hypothetical protein IQ07DRAFT_122991 [Pyrenochaeta sp. DS3sAY3a]|nr:hypothetical protein IQ07DRAFT_122991 [Pyrenochaeta sp. DS3sAY3a]